MRKGARFANRPRSLADLGLWCTLCLLAGLAIVAPDQVLALSPPCLITVLLDIECWGCGLVRATLALLHGQFFQAWALNPRVYVVLPLLAFVALVYTRRVFRPSQVR